MAKTGKKIRVERETVNESANFCLSKIGFIDCAKRMTKNQFEQDNLFDRGNVSLNLHERAKRIMTRKSKSLAQVQESS